MDAARKETIRENYKIVMDKIENATLRRNAGEGKVQLLAATKTVPAEEILFAVHELGLPLIGENKVQELLSKYEDIKNTVPLHLIGHLQTNKVKSIMGKVDMIQSCDSLRLAREISKRSLEAGLCTKVLCEINIGREENKGGVAPEEVLDFVSEISSFEGIEVAGLMTMAPVCETKDEYKKYFEKTYAIYLDFLRNKGHNRIENVLSMGMSDSFEAAIEEGATLVRVGSSIFGKRIYP